MIPVASIEPHPGQPRRIFQEEALAELAASIQARGVIQPIIVRPHGHRFQIVAGERRWRAAQKARLHEIPAIVREFSDDETLEVALIENIQRQDLNAIEEAQAYRRLVDDYGHTQEELGKLVHKSRSHVANLLRLLDLPAKVQVMVGDRRAQHGPCPRADHRRPIRKALAEEVVRRGLSVRETEKLARARQGRRASGRCRSNIRAPAPTSPRWSGSWATCSASRSRSSTAPRAARSRSPIRRLDQLDMICQRLSGRASSDLRER